MKKQLLKLFSPFEVLNGRERLFSIFFVTIVVITLWSTSGHSYIPTPSEIFGSLPRLVNQKSLMFNFQKSLFFCLKIISYSSLIALVFCYLSVIPLFRTFCEFLRKFRFLPSTGFSFLFMKIGGTIDNQMVYMMVFGVTVWLIDSMVKVALDIGQDEVNYAKSLRLNKWQRMRELLIYGRAADIFHCIITNFAIAWMLLAAIENIAKAKGGIGVVLAESNKYYNFAEVYALQIIILLTGISIDYLLRQVKAIVFPYTSLKH